VGGAIRGWPPQRPGNSDFRSRRPTVRGYEPAPMAMGTNDAEFTGQHPITPNLAAAHPCIAYSTPFSVPMTNVPSPVMAG
jgi:hypothetical protein